MVKNPLKKIKISKESAMSPEKVSAAVTESFIEKKTPSKSKKAKLNGMIVSKPNSEATNGVVKVEVKVNPQARHHSVGNLKHRLREENKFISDVLEFMVFPKLNEGDSDSEDEVGDVPEDMKVEMRNRLKKEGATRATSIGDLHYRLNKKMQELRGNVKPGKSGKRKLTKVEKKLKASQEKKLKNKLAKIGSTTSDFGNKMAQAAAKVGAKPAKPVFNSEGKMVFSKFDFTDDKGFKVDEAESQVKKPTLDPKSLLAKLQKQKEKIKNLEAEGNKAKARAIEEGTAWKTALDRSSGVKVKDDPTLLKKSIKKKEKKKKLTKQKWESRVEGEEKRKHSKQQKRNDNLGKRKTDKKDKQKKQAIKKGRVVPGFR